MLRTIAEMVDPNVWEPPYLFKVLDNLDLDDDYHFIIARTNTQQEVYQFKNCIKSNKKNILFLLSDERGIIPPFLDELYLVFRAYNRSDLYDNNKIFPIPCGYSYGHNNSFYKEENKKPLVDREYDLFYSAQACYNRNSCVEELKKIKDDFKSIVNVTDGFARGFKIEEYYNIMRNSKIAIVPNGAVVPESFRYFEAFESNCIVITSYPKDSNYNHWYYKNSPAIFISNWNQLTKDLVNNLLDNDNLNRYDSLNRKYFEENISPKGLSNYISKIIKEKNDKN